MAERQLKKYLVSLRVSLAEEALLQHSPSSAVVIGTALAEQVHDYVKRHQMGYYPALDFFSQQGDLDPDLINAAENISWLLCRLVANECETRLRQAFSGVKFESVQTIAYTMPAVRYGKNNAIYELAMHYTPLRVKLTAVVSMISHPETEHSPEQSITSVFYQCLEDSFESIDVSDVISIEAGP